jgi:hypothetical protein
VSIGACIGILRAAGYGASFESPHGEGQSFLVHVSRGDWWAITTRHTTQDAAEASLLSIATDLLSPGIGA